MDLFTMVFPVSGVETFFFIPPLVAFVISFFTSMAGVSGAFLLLPFQVSVLGFVTPSVSATNFLYNIVSIPGGVYRFIKENRMFWPLAWLVVAGTVPGLLAGYYLRVIFLPDPKSFKLFVGIVLMYVAFRLLLSLTSGQKSGRTGGILTFDNQDVSYGWKSIETCFKGEKIAFNPVVMFLLALVVGVIGGIYGIGGGAIIAPFCVSVLKLPVHIVAGAALLATFLTSIVGVVIYSFIPLSAGITSPPDWALGILFGVGGLAGMYLGAKTQKYVPEKFIQTVLCGVVLFVSVKYIVQFFL